MSLQLRRTHTREPDRVARLRVGDEGATLDVSRVAQHVGEVVEVRRWQLQRVVARAAHLETVDHVEAVAAVEDERCAGFMMVADDIEGLQLHRLPRRVDAYSTAADHARLIRAAGAERFALDRLCLEDEAPLRCEVERVREALGRVAEWMGEGE